MVTQFLTIPEVSRVLRVGQRTAYALARSGKLVGALKVGNQWRVSRVALDRWAESPRSAPGTPASSESPRQRMRARGATVRSKDKTSSARERAGR